MIKPLWVVVPAAGFGARMGGTLPKQYQPMAGSCMLEHTLQRLLQVPEIAGFVVVLAPDDAHWQTIPSASNPRILTAPGADTRAGSVVAGLQYVLDKADDQPWVLVHDAARPLICTTDIKRLIDAVYNSGAIGGILATPVQDTLKSADEYCCINKTVNREGLWQAQTPQLFNADQLLGAMHSSMKLAAESITDESSAMEAAGHEPLLVEALKPNLKVTRPVDFQVATALLESNSAGALS